jgi:hypothetical protein
MTAFVDGSQWVCPCGAANNHVRQGCRNCGARKPTPVPGPTAETAHAALVVLSRLVDVMALEGYTRAEYQARKDEGTDDRDMGQPWDALMHCWAVLDVARAQRDGTTTEREGGAPEVPPGDAGRGRTAEEAERDVAAYLRQLRDIALQRRDASQDPNRQRAWERVASAHAGAANNIENGEHIGACAPRKERE